MPFRLDILVDFVWRQQLVPLEHVVLGLVRGHRSDNSVAFRLLRMLLFNAPVRASSGAGWVACNVLGPPPDRANEAVPVRDADTIGPLGRLIQDFKQRLDVFLQLRLDPVWWREKDGIAKLNEYYLKYAPSRRPAGPSPRWVREPPGPEAGSHRAGGRRRL